MINVITPPQTIDWSTIGPSVFLAGSIENGAAPDWQAEVIETLTAKVTGNLTILNPRRADWDPKCSDLRGQIEWELEALARATKIVMFYAANTISPISLLELGLFARSGRVTVCCPAGYFRRANVSIVCERNKVREVDTLAELIDECVTLGNSGGVPIQKVHFAPGEVALCVERGHRLFGCNVKILSYRHWSDHMGSSCYEVSAMPKPGTVGVKSEVLESGLVPMLDKVVVNG